MKKTARRLLCTLLCAALLCAAVPMAAQAAPDDLRQTLVDQAEALAGLRWKLVKRITRTNYSTVHIAEMQRAGVRHSVYFEYERTQAENIGVIGEANSASLEQIKSLIGPDGMVPDQGTDFYPGMNADSMLTDLLSRVTPDKVTSLRQALTDPALVALLPQADVKAATSRQAADAAGFEAAKAAYAKLQKGDLLLCYEEPMPELEASDDGSPITVTESPVPRTHVMVVTGTKGDKVSVVYMGYTDPIYTFVCSKCGKVEYEGPTRNPVPDHLTSVNYTFKEYKTHRETDPNSSCGGTWENKGGTVWQHVDLSYDQLFGRGDEAAPYAGRAYLPYTLAAYSADAAVPVDVKFDTDATAETISAGLRGKLTSNYRIAQVDTVLSAPGKPDTVLTDFPAWDAWEYDFDNEQLNRWLFETDPGSYKLTLNVHTGPTSGGKESVVKVLEMPFTLDAPSFTLTCAQKSVWQGEDVTVGLRALTAGVTGAQVTMEYDRERLAFQADASRAASAGAQFTENADGTVTARWLGKAASANATLLTMCFTARYTGRMPVESEPFHALAASVSRKESAAAGDLTPARVGGAQPTVQIGICAKVYPNFAPGNSLLLVCVEGYEKAGEGIVSYGGKELPDVTQANYRLDGSGFTHVYGWVTPTVDRDKIHAEYRYDNAATPTPLNQHGFDRLLPITDDVNGDGVTDVSDVQTILNIAAGKLTAEGNELVFIRADLDRNGKIDAADARLLSETLTQPRSATAGGPAPTPVTPDASRAQQLFRWEAVANAETMMEQITDNLRRDASDRTKTHYIQYMDLVTADGPVRKPVYFLYNNHAEAYGLPRVARNDMFKNTESLYLTPNEFKPTSTAGLAAVNVSVVCGLRTAPKSIEDAAHAVGKFDVQVSLDGTTFLETGAALRSWKLVGVGTTSTNKSNMLFEIQSENLLDIPGVKAGDTIQKIRVRPHGKHIHNWGWFELSSITVNGFATQADWEAAVPDGHADLYPVGEELMRQITLAQCYRIMNEEWTADDAIYSDTPSGATGSHFNTIPGMTYHGPIYERPIKGDHETFLMAMKDGKYVGGRSTDDLRGMDCTVFAYDAYSRVSRSSSYILWKFTEDNSLYMLNSPKTDGCPMYSDTDVVALNDAQTMYEGYAMLKPGDVLATYNTQGGIHVRIVESVDVVRNADGTVDGAASKTTAVEQSSGIYYYYKDELGVMGKVRLDKTKAYNEFVEGHPEIKLLYGASTRRNSYSFSTLLGSYYIAYRPVEYDRGSIEALDIQYILRPVDGKDARNGFRGAVATDYYIDWVRTTLEDLGTGKVLFEEEYLPMLQDKYCYDLNSEKLNTILAALPNGSYRINMAVQAGPVTEPGAARPFTAEHYDFTISDKAPAAKVTLNGLGELAKGQSADVTVQIGAAWDGADVQIKYDPGKLSFVKGSASGSVSTVTEKNGLVCIVAAGAGASAGRMASLSFTARENCTLSDALEIKSAAITTAAAAMNAATKATDAAEASPSVRFSDVLKNAWYRPAVDYVYENSIMSGYSADTFGPDNTLTRAMVVQVLYNKENKPASSAQNPFKDIKADQWYFNAVRWGADKGVVAGYGGGVFKPDDNVTVEQVAVILHNYSGKPASGGDISALGAHSDWAEPALKWAAEKGIFEGMPDFAVTAPATRAQTAQMLTNYLQ